MANPRQEAHEAGRNAQEASKRMVEESGRAGRRMADVGEQTVRAGADIAQRNAETLQQAWESGSELANDLTRRSTEQFTRTFGFGGEEVEKATQQSSRNLEAIAQSSSILAQGMQEVSRECFDLMRKSVARNFDWMDAFARCRTPQELMAKQSEVARDSLEELLQTTRRTAEASVRMADEAARKIADAAEAARRSA